MAPCLPILTLISVLATQILDHGGLNRLDVLALTSAPVQPRVLNHPVAPVLQIIPVLSLASPSVSLAAIGS